ncbi:MAG: hypothetical protein M3O21_01805 [Chloroflexota bacterium]|nr:hypothetical protein [Chloroflexota bacterium]
MLVIVLLTMGLAVAYETAFGGGATGWHYYAAFFDREKAKYSNTECVAVGRMWVTATEVRIIYSGVGAPECGEATGGAAVQTLYHDGRESTFSESGASSSNRIDVSPLYTGDFSAMAKGAGAWCDPQYYTCEFVGTEEVAARSTVHIHVKHLVSQGAPAEAGSLDFWIDSETGRPLRATSGNGSTIDSDFQAIDFDGSSQLPAGVFSDQPFAP